MSRVAFDDDAGDASLSLVPLLDPKHSPHWQGLQHRDGDELIHTIEELINVFSSDLDAEANVTATKNGMAKRERLVVWSCVAGYVEALSTHKQQRYQIFPIPWTAIRRLFQDEFLSAIQSPTLLPSSSSPPSPPSPPSPHPHRDMVRAISNRIWSKTLSKPNVRDEMHANSIYVWLRGPIDKKSLDCFGAAVTTVAACHCLGFTSSQLALSEDHAYERHSVEATDGTTTIGTCEVAVPGTTKAAQAKRGREIGDTFASNAILTPETSWLYMADHAVVCDSLPMTLVAVVGNVNCTIDKNHKRGGTTRAMALLASSQLYDLKRDLLWVLYDKGHMSKFPFGLMELGDCEEHRGSPRSQEWVTVPDINEPILMNEKLFWDAIHINKTVYQDAQAYPYFYAGHYHKDAGNAGPEHEYRLVHAMKHYADAARIASKYRYEGIDSMQLNKHMSAAGMLIAEEILSPKYGESTTKTRRVWLERDHAVAVCTWLLGFFDSLLVWEELSGGKHFVEILSPSHKFGIGKLFQMLSEEVRTQVLDRTGEDSKLPYFHRIRSKRLTKGGLLQKALRKAKVTVGELELAILTDDENGGGRRSKRARR